MQLLQDILTLNTEQSAISGAVLDIEVNGLAANQRGVFHHRGLADVLGYADNGPCLKFNGTTDYASVITPFDALGGHRYALFAGMIYQTSNGSEAVLYQEYGTSTRALYIKLLAGGSVDVSAVINGTSESAATTVSVPLNTWVSVLLVVDVKDARLYVWLNGQIAIPGGIAFSGSFGATVWPSHVPPDQRFASNPLSKWFEGRIYNLCIAGLDQLPTNADAAAFHDNSFDWLKTNITSTVDGAWWPCYEDSDVSTVYDVSGNGHNLTLAGAIHEWSVSKRGQFGRGLNTSMGTIGDRFARKTIALHGQGDRIGVPNMQGSSSFTWMFKVALSADQGGKTVVIFGFKGNPSTTGSMVGYVTSIGILFTTIKGTSIYHTPSSSLLDDTDHWLGLRHDGLLSQFILDGMLVGSPTTTGELTPLVEDLYIGSGDDGAVRALRGEFADVLIYDYALPAHEIARICGKD